jgi:hypothetical protein
MFLVPRIPMDTSQRTRNPPIAPHAAPPSVLQAIDHHSSRPGHWCDSPSRYTTLQVGQIGKRYFVLDTTIRRSSQVA